MVVPATRSAVARIGRRVLAPLVLAAALATGPVQAQDADAERWIPTWSASPQPVWAPDFIAPVNVPRALRDQTIRQIARLSLGGSEVRIELSNEYGDEPLTIGAARVALAGEGSAILPDTDRVLTFGGRTSVTVPPGAPIVSDPVDLAIEPLGSVAVSLYLPEITPASTWHGEAVQTAYIGAAGDVTGAPEIAEATTVTSRLFLSEILVDARPGARAIVTFGDSITDGTSSTPDANHRWPDFLAERLVEAGANVAVVNQGISGARVLRDRMGVNALARFDRDVLSHPHADTVILLMGINDIGWPGTLLTPKGEPAPSAEDIIGGYEQLIARAHGNGMRIIGATLTPFENTFEGNPLFGYYNEEKEAKRQAVNAWIRESGAFDGVIDFDAAVRDPANPKHIRAEFDSGDHLHPQDAGYEAMADAVDLELLGVKP
ncbi:SGNH/GDSL hydrolase family protein [Marinivivus vitaminiproducens]|uniref:SGNH/GDSL hydrolase family protein n=1 Tax=Marinivivus vitaminiproducens TaxID=3035935 RepID=UPI0027A98998|nr:SGNH/GDSL hydrolase family protein [Geminicoccaceae bacterium SCSIO 64248]